MSVCKEGGSLERCDAVKLTPGHLRYLGYKHKPLKMYTRTISTRLVEKALQQLLEKLLPNQIL